MRDKWHWKLEEEKCYTVNLSFRLGNRNIIEPKKCIFKILLLNIDELRLVSYMF